MCELDLTKAYYQMPLTDNAIPLTAFPTSKGMMEFVRCPFGLNSAPNGYNKLMRRVLAGLNNLSFYFDNIYIFGRT